MHSHHLTQLKDRRLTERGNRILDDLFCRGCHSIRRFSQSEADAKGCYRFLSNERVNEADLIANLKANCGAGAAGKLVVCIQDTTQIHLGAHTGRLSKEDSHLGPTNNRGTKGYGFLIHPSLVLDAVEAIPYGYAAIKLWHRDQQPAGDSRAHRSLRSEEKESYRWIEVSKGTKETLSDVVEGMVIIQDREGDIYEQYAAIPDTKTALLIRAKANRALEDGTKLSDAIASLPCQGTYSIAVVARDKRKGRTATIEIRYREVVLRRPRWAPPTCPSTLPLYLIEAKERDYSGKDAICWRLLTTLDVADIYRDGQNLY